MQHLTHTPLEESLGRILWLALEALHKENREELYEKYLALLKINLRSRHPRCILDGLPTHLQHEIELGTFDWQFRFTWENLGADELDMEQLYNTRVIMMAERYFQNKQQGLLRTLRPTTGNDEYLYACLRLLREHVPLAIYLGDCVGTPVHRCQYCTNAFALACKDTYMCFFWRFPWEPQENID